MSPSSRSPESWRINIIGLAGSGKSTLARALSSHYNASIFRPSDVIRTHALQAGHALTQREDYVATHRHLLQQDPEAITRPVTTSQEQRLIIDGLRVVSHVNTLRQQCGMLTIALIAPPEFSEQAWARIRLARINADETWRTYRTDAHIHDVESFLDDEAADRGYFEPGEPNIDEVIATAEMQINATLSANQVTEEAIKLISTIPGRQSPVQ